ncbi:MAG: hypothetical protein U1F83_02785 [Verrucomicrobiota bacterium]
MLEEIALALDAELYRRRTARSIYRMVRITVATSVARANSLRWHGGLRLSRKPCCFWRLQQIRRQREHHGRLPVSGVGGFSAGDSKGVARSAGARRVAAGVSREIKWELDRLFTMQAPD